MGSLHEKGTAEKFMQGYIHTKSVFIFLRHNSFIITELNE